jgi:Ser/Thr protein kinase RdoA (MazF antagonist)
LKRTNAARRAPRQPAGPAELAREVWGLDAAPAMWEGERSFTGKVFARLVGQSGTYYLRRLPDGTAFGWLEAIHDAVAFLDRNGFSLFPRFEPTETGETAARFGGQLYDLTRWVEGAPPRVADLDAAALGELGAAIARLHLAGQGAPGPRVRFDWLTERQRLTLRLAWDPTPCGKDPWQDPANLATYFDSLVIPDEAAPEARAVVDEARAALARLERAGTSAPPEPADEPVTLTHGDLWADHVRYSDGRVSALLDPDTLALRSPRGDVAALCADFGLWQPGRCRALLAGYRAHRPLDRAAVASLPRLAALRTLGVLRARLRAWLASDGARGPAPLAGPLPYWRDQLHLLTGLDPDAFAAMVE